MGLKRLFRKAILHIPLCNEEKAELFFIPSYIKNIVFCASPFSILKKIFVKIFYCQK